MRPVRARLLGGLGNQMFIAATAVAIASRIGTSVQLQTFGSESSRHGQRNDLGIFPELVQRVEIRSSRQNWPLALQMRLDRVLPRVLREQGFSYDDRVENLRSPLRLSGYFQAPRYFETLDARSLFRIDNNPRLEAIRRQVGDTWVALHVRSGDFKTHTAMRYHGTCGEHYYQQAVEVVRVMMNQSLPTVVFTDVPNALWPSLRKEAALILGPHQDVHAACDIWAIAESAAVIIPNSSFAWWGAFLGDRAERPVVAPRPWLRHGDVAGSDLLLPTWISLGATEVKSNQSS